MLNALLAVSMCLSQAPVEEAAEPEPLKWEIFVGVGGGLRTDNPGGGGVGIIGVNRRLFSWLRPELSVGLGWYATPFDTVIPIRIGTRIEWPSDARLKPYLFIAFAHQHEMGFEDTKADPVGGLLGLSSHGEHGVHHRSGLETGLGLSYDLIHGHRFGLRVNLRASMTHLLGEGPTRYVDLLGTVGLTI